VPLDERESQNQVQAQLNIRQPYILYLGDNIERKNLRRLLDAFSILVHEYHVREFQLVLVTPESSSLTKQVEALGVAELVRFVDFCTEDLKPHIYAAATAFIYPSLFEGFGLPSLRHSHAERPWLPQT
jgi:glycosyltransferase involved in cell wall biosynthesis